MFRLAIIPLEEGGVDYTVFDSSEENIIAQGTIPASELRASTLAKLLPSLGSEDASRLFRRVQALDVENETLEMSLLEW